MIKNYLQISIASPKKIATWCERKLPNEQLVGKITKPVRNSKIIINIFIRRIFLNNQKKIL